MRDDALPFARILLAGAAIVVAVTAAILVVAALLTHRRVPFGGTAVDRPVAPGAGLPMLQSAPQADLAAYREEKARALGSLGWVDAASGVAHLPIDRAMDLLVQRAASAPADTASGAGQ